jgi:hypothetical protein
MANNRPLDRVSGHPALRKSSIMWTRPSSPPRGPLTSREHQPCTDRNDRADTGSNKVGTGEGSARRLGGRHLGRIPRQEGAICRPRHCEGYRTAAPSPLQARVMLYWNLRLRVGLGAGRAVRGAKAEWPQWVEAVWKLLTLTKTSHSIALRVPYPNFSLRCSPAQ